jgi:peroxiredoxin
MVGAIAENFSLRDQDGNTLNLYENRNENILLVF